MNLFLIAILAAVATLLAPGFNPSQAGAGHQDINPESGFPVEVFPVIYLPMVAYDSTPPIPPGNWILNGKFDQGIVADKRKGSVLGWTQVHGYWWDGIHTGLHDPIHEGICPADPPFYVPSGTWYLQMDRDNNPPSLDLWPPPVSEDWIYQDVQAPGPHSILHLHWEEAHHMYAGDIQLRVYGKNGAGIWEEIFLQDGVQSPFGTGKCPDGPPPASFDVAIEVAEGGFGEYRIEIYGKMVDPRDGVLWGDFRLWGE